MHSLNIQSADNDDIGALKKLCADLGYKKTSLFGMAVSFYKDKDGGKALNTRYEERLRMFALIKQARFGPFTAEHGSDSGVLNLIGKERNRVWQGLADMSPDAARDEFISTLVHLCPFFSTHVQAHCHLKRHKLEEAQERERFGAKTRQAHEEVIRSTLRRNVDSQFRKYAEKICPKNLTGQDELLERLHDNHYEQYKQQVYQLDQQQQQQQQLNDQELSLLPMNLMHKAAGYPDWKAPREILPPDIPPLGSSVCESVMNRDVVSHVQPTTVTAGNMKRNDLKWNKDQTLTSGATNYNNNDRASERRTDLTLMPARPVFIVKQKIDKSPSGLKYSRSIARNARSRESVRYSPVLSVGSTVQVGATYTDGDSVLSAVLTVGSPVQVGATDTEGQLDRSDSKTRRELDDVRDIEPASLAQTTGWNHDVRDIEPATLAQTTGWNHDVRDIEPASLAQTTVEMSSSKDRLSFIESLKSNEKAFLYLSAGESITLHVPMSCSDRGVSWEFATDSRDIGFSVTYKSSEPTNHKRESFEDSGVTTNQKRESFQEDRDQQELTNIENANNNDKSTGIDYHVKTQQIFAMRRCNAQLQVFRGSHACAAPLAMSNGVHDTPLTPSYGVYYSPLGASNGVYHSPLTTSNGVYLSPLEASNGVNLSLLEASKGVNHSSLEASKGVYLSPLEASNFTGVYHIQFDNSYSLWYNKRVYYKITYIK